MTEEDLAPITSENVLRIKNGKKISTMVLPNGVTKDHMLGIQALAVSLMTEHGLTDNKWTFEWDNAQRRAGQTRYADKVISLSVPLMAMWPEDDIRDTILHEIAHALAGDKAGHNRTWQLTALKIGAKPNRCYEGELKIEGNWEGTCPNGHTIRRFRKTAKMYKVSCSRCNRTYDPRFKFTWKRVQDEQ